MFFCNKACETGAVGSIVRIISMLTSVVAASASHDRMDMIDAYLGQFGIRGLPPLSVKFGTRELHGEVSSYLKPDDDSWMNTMPDVSWRFPPGTKATVLFIDIDAGGRPASDTVAGAKGPYIHSLWTDCTAGTLSASSCREVKPYKAPGNIAAKKNRYTWVLFKQGKDDAVVDLKWPGMTRFGTHFDMAQFQKANPGFTAAATNFMQVGGNKLRKARKGRRKTM